MKGRLEFSDKRNNPDSHRIKRRKKTALLPLLSFLGAALFPTLLYPVSFPQNVRSDRISMKYIKNRKTLTPFSAPAEWDIQKDSFSVSRVFIFRKGDIAISALMESRPCGKGRISRFSITRLEKKKKGKWKIAKSFDFKLDALEKRFTPSGRLKGGKIILDHNAGSSVFLFYVVPDNGIATGLQNEQPITRGIPVAVFRYDENRQDAKEEGIKKITSP